MPRTGLTDINLLGIVRSNAIALLGVAFLMELYATGPCLQ